MTDQSATTAQQNARLTRGAALKRARAAAGLTATELAQRVNDRTAGSGITHHAIYSYERGKVLLSREFGHRLAQVLNLHPGELLIGDPDYASTPTPPPEQSADAVHAEAPPPTEPDPRASSPASDGDRWRRVQLVRAGEQARPVATVTVRLLRTLKLGRLDAEGFIDLFHLLLEDLAAMTAGRAAEAVDELGRVEGNDALVQLLTSARRLEKQAESLFKSLIDGSDDPPSKRYDDFVGRTDAIAQELDTFGGLLDANNKHMPGVSLD
ncbi:MAG: helix-turn-helix domain-containing protein [Planctomycetota bacterium]